MNKKHLGIIIGILICVLVSIGKDIFNNTELTQVNNSELNGDGILQDYIKGNIPDTALLLNSTFVTDYTQIKSNKNMDINSKIDTDVYSFVSYKEGLIYTVISLIYPNEIKISKKDLIEVITSDYLRPVSPAYAIFLAKNKKEDEWVKIRDINAMVNMSGVSIYEGEIYSVGKYSRVILSFSSLENPQAIEATPYYHIRYLNFLSYSYIMWTIVVGLLLFCVSTVLVYFKSKH